MRWVLALAIAVSVPPAFAADVVSGNFHYGNIRFKPVDAVAYQMPGQSGKPPVTLIAFADYKIDRDGFREAIDPLSSLINQINKNERGSFVVVRLTAPDRCGLSGLIGAGARQIGLSDDFISKASVGASRVAGRCSTSKPGKMFDDTYDFDLSYDVPLIAIPQPSPLAAGGGEPGQAYSALVKAINAADWNVASIHLPENELPSSAPKASEMRDYFHGVGLNYPKTVTVTGGLIKGNLATLDLKGTDREDKKTHGAVMMKKTGSNWRVVEQSFYFDQ